MNHLTALVQFLSSVISESDPDADSETISRFIASAKGEQVMKITSQLRQALEMDVVSIEDLGATSNRWFTTSEEAKEWLSSLLKLLDQGSGSDSVVVKDSNGAVLVEGDSVTVIKDLKVKGGSSDLKRGTLVKKIHLVDDPDVVECRVNGSVLVLRTEFLKKA